MPEFNYILLPKLEVRCAGCEARIYQLQMQCKYVLRRC